jgi:dynein heavy chain, axonemal
MNFRMIVYNRFFCSKADLEAKTDLSDMKQDLIDRVNSVINKSNEFKDSFNKYAYLWTDDRKEFMRQFLLYNHVLTQEEIEAHAETGVPESPPTLEQFKAQVIQNYKELTIFFHIFLFYLIYI